MTTNVKVNIQGRGDLEVPADIAASDETLIAALAPFYDAIDTAEITREEKDGQTTITIVPTGGRKAAYTVLEELLGELVAAPPALNPAVTLLHALEIAGITTDPIQLLPLVPEIDATLAAGQREVDAVHAVARALVAQPTVPASYVPLGL